MTFNLIIALFIAHFGADWILQPRWMAKQKSENFLVCLLHGFVIFLFLLATFLIATIYGLKYDGVNILIFTLLYSVIHVVQDWFIWRFYKKFLFRRFNKTVEFYDDYWFYSTIAVDQFLHLSLLFYFVSLIPKL
jgi:hypothetical protein